MDRRSFLATTAAGAATLTFPNILRAQTKDPIRIGFPLPLTGPFGALAADQQRGATLAMDELNAKGGILGRKVEVLFRDDQLKPAVGAQRTKELIENDKVQFVVGGLAAHVQMAINEQTKKAKVLFISVSQSDEISAKPDTSPLTFHEALNPTITSRAVGNWIAQNLARSGGSSTPTTRGASRTTPSSPRPSPSRAAPCSARRPTRWAAPSSPRTCQRSRPRSPRCSCR